MIKVRGKYYEDRQVIAQFGSLVYLLGLLEWEIGFHNKLLCPFHEDNRASAKVHLGGTDGDRLYCYSCARQFSAYDLIMAYPVELNLEQIKAEMLPQLQQMNLDAYFENVANVNTDVDISFLDGYIKGDMNTRDFFNRLYAGLKIKVEQKL